MTAPRPALPSTATVLRPGLDSLPSRCSSCAGRMLVADPPMGRSLYGTLSCLACGGVLAYLGASFDTPSRRPHAPLHAAAASPTATPEEPDESWRSPGCAETCRRRSHDPYAHEAHGRQQARIALQTLARGALTVGPLTLDLDRHRCIVDGQPVHLTPNEFRLLARLARSAGTVVTQAELLEAVWGFAYAGRPRPSLDPFRYQDAHLLRMNVTRIRQRLGSARRLIRTVPAIGYMMTDEP